MVWLIIPVVIGIASILYQLLHASLGIESSIKRLERFAGTTSDTNEASTVKKHEYRQGIGTLARGIERSSFFSSYRLYLRKLLVNANILMKPEEFIAVQLMLAFLSFVMTLMLSGSGVFSLITFILGLILPRVYIGNRIKGRLKTINSQLGDTLAILSNALKAGHSFFQAIDSVSREMTGPVAEEFSKLQKEINFGVNTEAALENMVQRVGSDDLELVVTAVLIQRQVGGNLSEVLDNISGTIRQRVKMKGEIKALTAQGRMSGWVIGSLPLVLATMMAIISPEQILVMFREPLGLAMIGFAVISESIGIFLIKKTVNIEV